MVFGMIKLQVLQEMVIENISRLILQAFKLIEVKITWADC